MFYDIFNVYPFHYPSIYELLGDTLARFVSQLLFQGTPQHALSVNFLTLWESAMMLKGEGSKWPQAEPGRGWLACFYSHQIFLKWGYSKLMISYNCISQAKPGGSASLNLLLTVFSGKYCNYYSLEYYLINVLIIHLLLQEFSKISPLSIILTVNKP